MAAGQKRINNFGSWGPALYAVAPWESGNPPADGTVLNAIQLLYYPDKDNKMQDFSHSDEWTDGAWLTVGNKSAVIFAGTKGVRTMDSGLEYYGEAGPDGCRPKGYQAEPYYGAILFYDPDNLAEVAQGLKQPYELQPYAVFQVENYMFNKATCKFPILGGIGYDRNNNLLYVNELGVDGVYDKKPIVHVWRIKDAGQEPDTQSPTEPKNIHIVNQTESEITIQWDTSTDNIGNIMYIIYRNNKPIAITTKTTFTDTKISYFSPPYNYTVEARDAVNNSSSSINQPPSPPKNLRIQ